MNRKAFLKIVFIIFLCMPGITGYAQSQKKDASPSKADLDVTRLEKKINTAINRERAKNGLPPLLWDESLHKVARKHSQDMVDRNFFSHSDPDGRGFHDRYEAGGFECEIRVGNTTYMGAENISQDVLYRSRLYIDDEKSYTWNSEDEIANSVVKHWMSSGAHRKNILTPYFKRHGIGVALSADGKVYVTENFC